MAKPKGPIANIFDLDGLVKETAKNVGTLTEFFRLNLLYYQLISGKGLEFEKVRQYQYGDDVRRMDWKIYARTQELYIKVYREEREFDIVIILDVSNSMLLGTNNWTKNEFGAMVAGALSYAAIEAGDNVGGGCFSHEKQSLVDPESDYIALFTQLADVNNYGGKKNWAKLTNELISNYSSDAIVFIISDFIDSNPEVFLPELSSSFSKVYGIMIRDPIDNELPEKAGRIYVRDPVTNRVLLTNTKKVKAEYDVLAQIDIKRIKDLFHQYGQICFSIVTGEDFSREFIKALGGEQVEIF